MVRSMFHSMGLFVAGVVGMLLLCELLLRLLPVPTSTATGYHIDPWVSTYPAGHRFQMATGWDLRNANVLQANNWGFVSDVDFTPNAQAIALIGDSFIESSMLDAGQRPAARLAALVGSARPVYAMGSPGTSVLDYAERIRLATQRLEVRDVVIFLVRGDVREAFCGSGNNHGPCLNRDTLVPGTALRPEASGLKRVLRHVALLQFMTGQLKVAPGQVLPALAAVPAAALPRWVGWGKPPAAAAQTQPEPMSAATVQRISRAFFDRIRPFVRGRLVVVVDHAQPGEAGTAPDLESELFAAAARAEGATVVSMAQRYAEHASRSRLSLYVGPYDLHLNALGIGLVADAMHEGLRQAPARWPGSTAPAQ